MISVKFNNSQAADESDLVECLSKGDIQAFNKLFRLYSGGLFRFAYGYLKSEAEAEDLVQEVFLIIWKKREDLKKELCFRAFLFTIIFNLIRRQFRIKKNLQEYITTLSETGTDNSTLHKVAFNSLDSYLRQLVDQLPERRKEIFIKSRFEGLSIKEIADEFGISHKTVENQITDALRFLRRHLWQEYS